jgi:hypothetical protein
LFTCCTATRSTDGRRPDQPPQTVHRKIASRSAKRATAGCSTRWPRSAGPAHGCSRWPAPRSHRW